jgi:citrate synthase
MKLQAQVFENGIPITQSVEIDTIEDRYIPAVSLAGLKIPQTIPPPAREGDTVPLRCFDPGYKNTTVCKTSISLVQPDGKCYYRGYDLEDLVARCNYLEVSYLLINGKLPNSVEYDDWAYQVLHHTYIHTELQVQMTTFRYDAHPMGMFLATLGKCWFIYS